jgi:Receptor L domain
LARHVLNALSKREQVAPAKRQENKMSFKHSLAAVSSILALASTACGTGAVVPLTPATMVTCHGGTIRSAAAAALYRGCHLVQGDLTVSASDLTDLASLSQLRHVTGTLRISESSGLDDLSALESLGSVGALEIHHDTDLDDLAGLQGLHEAGRVEVTDNPELRTLNGLQGLSATGRLVLRNNALFTATGLGGLREVGELVVVNNRQLNSLSGLRALTRARSVELAHNPVLYGKDLFPELERLDAPLMLGVNRAISKSAVRALLERTGQMRSSQLALGQDQRRDASTR